MHQVLGLQLLAALMLTFLKADHILVEQGFLDSPILNLVWCTANNDKILLALTDNGSVYRSVTRGSQWIKKSDDFQQAAMKVIDESESLEDTRFIAETIRNPYDENTIIFIGKGSINWITTDCGNTLRAMNHGRPVSQYIFHPTQKKWLLAGAWSLCTDLQNNQGVDCVINKQLFYSDDLGGSWDLLVGYVYQFSWGIVNDQSLHCPDQRIIVAYDSKGYNNQTSVQWKESVRVSFSDDFFETTKTLVVHGNHFLITEDFFIVARAIDDASDFGELLVAPIPQSFTMTYDFLEIELPSTEQLRTHSYRVLESSNQQIFIHINHNGPTDQFGSVYISDSTGVKYSLSLQYHVGSPDTHLDFVKVEGLQAIYIANVFDKEKLEMNAALQEEDEDKEKQLFIVNDEFDIQRATDESRQEMILQKKYQKTMISFDNGGIWKPLLPPELDVDNQPINCAWEEGCSLHLHTRISGGRYSGVYSAHNSIGLIIANGNIGPFLSEKTDQINTYISTDAGKSWSQVLQGSHFYEVGDHGGIIVMISDQEATDILYYSYDEGRTLYQYKFNDKPIEVSRVIIEPSNTGFTFLIIAEQDNMMERKGVIIMLDFGLLHQDLCKGADIPDEEESDYELWSPRHQNDDTSCLLGRRSYYVKKKAEKRCFNGQSFERKAKIQNCQCTEQDWQCDMNFVRQQDGPCVKEDGKEISFEAPENCDGFYYISLGYRQIPSDTCIDGVQHQAIKAQCPGWNRKAQEIMFGLIVLLIFVLLVLKASLLDQLRFYLEHRNVLNSKQNDRDNYLRNGLGKKKSKARRGLPNIYYDSGEDDGEEFLNDGKAQYSDHSFNGLNIIIKDTSKYTESDDNEDFNDDEFNNLRIRFGLGDQSF